jgi:hypothetical protein
MRAAVALLVLVMAAVSACGSPNAPSDPNLIKVNGTVQFMSFEGGFWAVRGDDNVTYDPMNGVPASFQVQGLRVRMEARRRDDMASIHMAGPIVEILSLSRIP